MIKQKYSFSHQDTQRLRRAKVEKVGLVVEANFSNRDAVSGEITKDNSAYFRSFVISAWLTGESYLASPFSLFAPRCKPDLRSDLRMKPHAP